ncbi:DUF418 domain-containing protein [Sphingomonas endolithica]|uniref:DUF418 domain-containing protein n=1 Tax=Sphingomonas endolithica TaxID=2972485 RepID=UPI0021AF13ED|nr:DUF418 domain-containing protein [Sphingomonas sp. ZFBP2030]
MNMVTTTEPDGAPRIATLDILRGIAILGILFMNINDMGGSFWASSTDIRHLGWTTADQIAWWLREVLADGTARCLLEMLFGVGMVILTERAAAKLAPPPDYPSFLSVAADTLFGPLRVLRAYYWRNVVLFLFGLVHLFILLWPGDILHTYGIAAMVAFLFRRLEPRALLMLGLVMAMLQLLGGGIGVHMAQQARIEVPALEARLAAGEKLTPMEKSKVETFAQRRAEGLKQKNDQKRRISREDRHRSAATGTFGSWAQDARTGILFIWGVADGIGDSVMLEPLFVWEAAGTMLIGAALFKWGIIQGRRSRRFYAVMAVMAYAVGLSGRAIGAYWATRFDDQPHLIDAASEVLRLATTFGHIGLVNLMIMSIGGAALLRPFVAAGRAALTLYVLQTIICLWILYPPFALGLYGKTGWAVMMLTALAIDIALLWLANMWLRHFAIAPVEWAWRSLVARRALPWRRRPIVSDNSSAGGIAAA